MTINTATSLYPGIEGQPKQYWSLTERRKLSIRHTVLHAIDQTTEFKYLDEVFTSDGRARFPAL